MPVIPKPKPLSASLPDYDQWPDWLKKLIDPKTDPSTEPLAPADTSEPDTWMGGFKKGLYNEFVRPATSPVGAAMLMGAGAEAIPPGLSKAEFAAHLLKNPEAKNLLTSEAGAVKADALVPQQFIDLIKKTSANSVEFRAAAMKKIEAAIRAGEDVSKENWKPLKENLQAFGDDPAGMKMFSRFWGAMSPNTPVGRTNYEALQAQKAMLEGTTPFKAGQLDMTNQPAKLPNLNKALEYTPLQSSRGETGKTEAMSRLNAGEPDTYQDPAIPVDTQAIFGVGGREGSIADIYPQIRELLGQKGKADYTANYRIVADAYRKGLETFGKDMFPQMWEGIKIIRGQGASQGLSATLEKLGLLEPNAMLDTGKLDEAIQNFDKSTFASHLPNMQKSLAQRLKGEAGVMNISKGKPPEPFVEPEVKPLTPKQSQTMDKMFAQASPTFKKLESEGMFQGDRSTIGAAPSALLPEKQFVQDIYTQTMKNQGTAEAPIHGVTYNLYKGNLAGTPNYAVSTFPERSLDTEGAPTPKVIAAYIKKNMDVLKDPLHSVGTWWDKDAQKFTTDVVRTIPDREEALALGRTHGQKAIYDLGKMEEIPVERRSGQKTYQGTERRFTPTTDARHEELLKKLGGTQKPPDLMDEFLKSSKLEPVKAGTPWYDGEKLIGHTTDKGGSTGLELLPDKMMQLEHRTPQADLTTIDPSFYGKGQAGAEKGRSTLPGFIPRSYFTIAGQKVEGRFAKLPKLNAEVVDRTVYDLTQDPLGLIPQAQAAGGGDEAKNLLDQLVVKAGFRGMHDGTMVAYFDKVPVKR
jgi:hypothetical protein